MPDFEKISLSEEQMHQTVFVSGDAHPELAVDIVERLGIEHIPVKTSQHPNSEEYVNILRSVRGKDVVVMQTHAETDERKSGEALIQHLLLMSAAKEASAKQITAFSPNVYGARQDKKTFGQREPITIKLTLQMLALAGADRSLFVDIHSEQSLVAFPGVAENIRALELVLKGVRGELTPEELRNLDVVAPDEGRGKTARRAAKILGARAIILDKERSSSDSQDVSHTGVALPDLTGRTAVIIDDMIDTAGTIISAKDAISAAGSSNIYAAATHPWLSDPAVERLSSSGLKGIILTDTNPQAKEAKPYFDADPDAPKFTVVSSAGFLSDALRQVIGNGHLEAIYENKESLKN